MATPRLIVSAQTAVCLSSASQTGKWHFCGATTWRPRHSRVTPEARSGCCQEGVGKGPRELSARKRQAAVRPVGAPSSREEEAEPTLCSAPRRSRGKATSLPSPACVRRSHGCTRSKIRGPAAWVVEQSTGGSGAPSPEPLAWRRTAGLRGHSRDAHLQTDGCHQRNEARARDVSQR